MRGRPKQLLLWVLVLLLCGYQVAHDVETVGVESATAALVLAEHPGHGGGHGGRPAGDHHHITDPHYQTKPSVAWHAAVVAVCLPVTLVSSPWLRPSRPLGPPTPPCAPAAPTAFRTLPLLV